MLSLFRRRFDFLGMLEDQAKKSNETLQALYAFMSDPTPQASEQVENLEKKADEMRTRLVAALNASFITPLDREDIYGLSRTIDDIADYARTTVEEMNLFEVPPDEHLREMVKALEEGSRMICEAVCLLRRDSTRSATMVSDILVRVKKTENGIERKYRRALKDLFESPDVIKILKAREIYRHLSNAADRMDEAANILGDILIKTT